jgi:serine/threonine protein kinase/Tfp pilus assembly protein PilF
MKCPKCQSDNPDTSRFCAECGTQILPAEEVSVSTTKTLETPQEELTTGSTFAGRYQMIEELGKGGMGKVYKVVDTKIKEKIALKLLKPEIAADKKTIERFSNELKFARKIRHENVCQMFDLNEEKGILYITMEYVSGDDLKSMIRMMGQLSPGQAVSITKQVCDGLEAAHKLGVVHRDLKPQNLMIDRNGNARIMDFGIARSIKAKGITSTGVMIGTPEYMSPEQVEGKEVDQRSDIYSMGVILYELVTGRVPFEGDTPFSIGMKHKSEEPRDPKELNVQVPDDLSHMILKCMEKDKGNRYQSAEELRSELIKIEKGIPTAEKVIPKRKPITSREITVTFGLKKLFIPALVVVAVVIAALVIWQLRPKKEAVPIPSDKPSLAVMYFENNTGDESLDHWRKALSNLLITDLAQSKFIQVLSADRLFNILEEQDQLEAKSFSTKVLKEVAAKGNANHILQGSYAKAGDIFRINVTLQDTTTMELIASEAVEGKGESGIFSMVDELTRKIKKNFKLTAEKIASDVDREIGRITTSSPEAFKYYSEGRIHHNKADYRKSIQFMEKAIEIDPEFAMAYRNIGASYGSMGYAAKGREYFQKAFELSDRLSDKERYWIQGDFYKLSEKTYDKAIEAFKKLLALYPDNRVGNFKLGQLYDILEQWDKAIERYEVDIQNRDETLYSYHGQARSYRAKGLYDKAKEVLEYYLNSFRDDSWIRGSLALNYLCQAQYNRAFAEADKAIFLNPAIHQNISRKGDIFLCKGDLIEAEKEYQKLLEMREQSAQLLGRDGLGALYLLQGRFAKSKEQVKEGMELAIKLGSSGQGFHFDLVYLNLKSKNPQEALEECEEAWKSAVKEEHLGYQRSALYWRGYSYLMMKSMDEAQRMADELKAMYEKALNKKLIKRYYHLMGMIELERKNFPLAIEYFKKAIYLLPFQFEASRNHAIFHDSLASAYFKARNIDKAREEYEKIISLTVGRIYAGDIYAKSFYMLGKIYQQNGQKGKAIEQYEKFLDLWKNADPGIAEVEEAKKQLSNLKKFP